jgi:hypothetical protein
MGNENFKNHFIMINSIARLVGFLWVFSLMGGMLVAQVTVTKKDSLFTDASGNELANPGDSLRYKAIILNENGSTADSLDYKIIPGTHLNFNPATVRTSPVAANDTFAVTGNVGIMVPAANGLKLNDFDDDLSGATIMAEMKMSAMGGNVTINADGSFSYLPPPGYTGSDHFTYTLLDGNHVVGGGPSSNDATVTLNVANLIWFIDNSKAVGDGRLQTPFNSLSAFNMASTAAAEVVYIEHTGTDYTGGIALQNNERLFGEGYTGSPNLANVLPFSLAMFSFPLPAINGSRPVITNGSGDGVTLATGNVLRGFNIGNCSDFGVENVGSVGNLMVSEVMITNATGGGFRAAAGSGAMMSVVFDAITSTGGVNGISLTNCQGSFTVNGGTITNPTGTAVEIVNGSVVFSSSGNISDNTGFAVDINNHDSGNVTFSGNITSTGSGIRVTGCGGGTKTFSGSTKNLMTTVNNAVELTGNSGAVIIFSNGGLAITTTSGIGFNATGGGVVNLTTGTNHNTITTMTGIGVNIQSPTNIGGVNGFTLRSVTVNNGGASSAASGIRLNGTTGFFIVTGDATLARNGSGGTINRTTDDAIDLTNAQNVTLQSMNLTNNGNQAPVMIQDAQTTTGDQTVQINGGSNIVMSGLLIQNPTGTGILALNLGGTNRFNHNSRIEALTATAGHGIYVANSNVTMTLFELNNVQMVNNASNLTNAYFGTLGSGNMNVDIINKCLFTDLGVQAVQITGGDGALSSGTMTSRVLDSAFKNAKGTGENNLALLVNGGIHISTVERDTFDNIAELGNIANTSIIRTQNSSIGGQLNATIRNSIIRNISYPAGGRHVIGHVFEPAMYNASHSTTLLIENNTATNITYTGTNREFVFVDYRANASGGNITIRNNSFNMPSAGTQQLMELRFRQIMASTVNVLVSGNTGTGNTAVAFLDIDAEDAATVNTTITNNNFTNSSGTPGFSIAVATEDAGSTMCANISGNILSAAGNTIDLNEQAGTMNITQASQAALSAANGGATVSVGGTPTFGAPACILPP